MPDFKANKTLDTIGLYCPVPLMQTTDEMDSIEVGEILEVLADDPGAKEDIKRFVKRTGHEIVKLEAMDLYLPCPDHTTVSRHNRTVNVCKCTGNLPNCPVHLIV